MIWAAAGACAAVGAFTAGMARWRAAAAPAAVPDAAVASALPVAAQPAPATEVPAAPSAPPADTASPWPQDVSLVTAPSPTEPSAEAPARPAPRPVVVVSSAPFWSIPAGAATVTRPASAPPTALASAPTPAPAPTLIPPTPLPARILSGRWTGFVTDEFCREKGAVSDHGQCLETCLRRGRQPMILLDGQLYRLINIDRIRGLHDKAVVVEGQLDLERRVFIAASGGPR